MGAGNSAGQAIVALSRYARRVHVIARALDLGKSMSRYLVDRVERIDNVQIHRGAVVTALEGDGHLQAIRIRDDAGVETRIDTRGAVPLHRGRSAHRMAEWLRAARQEGFRPDRRHHSSRYGARRPLARTGANAVVPGDEPSGRCSPRETFGADRSNAARRRSARAPWRSASFTRRSMPLRRRRVFLCRQNRSSRQLPG